MARDWKAPAGPYVLEDGTDEYKLPAGPYVNEDQAAAGAGWTGKIIGATDPSKINGIAVAGISKVNGVA